MKEPGIYGRIIVNFILTLLSVIIVVCFVPKLLHFFLPFVIAFIISVIANPLVKFMEKRIKIVRKHGSAIIIVVALIAVVGLLYLLGSIIVSEVIHLINDFSEIKEELTKILAEISAQLEKYNKYFPKGIRNLIGDMNQGAEEFLGTLFNSISIEVPSLTQASGYVKGIANGFFLAIITVLASYFFIAEQDKIVEGAKKIFPESIQKGYHVIVTNFKDAVGGYFKAQFKIMLLLTVIMFLTFWFMGVKYAFLIAFLIAFIDLLPVFGTGAILWPWTAVLFITGEYGQAIVLIILYLACQLIKQFLQPKMVGDSIGISPLSTLIFMFIGYRISGVLGMIIGIPVGMALSNFYRMGAFDRLIKGIKIIVTDINEYRKY